MTANVASKINIYLISHDEELADSEVFFKIGSSKDIKKRLCHLQLGNPRQLKIEFSYEAESFYALTIEKFIHKNFKPFHIHGEWFKANLHQSVKLIKSLIDDFNRNKAKYRRLAKKERWGSGGGNLPYGKNSSELLLIKRLLELRHNGGKRKLSIDKCVAQLHKEGFRSRKGTRLSRQQAYRIVELHQPLTAKRKRGRNKRKKTLTSS